MTDRPLSDVPNIFFVGYLQGLATRDGIKDDDAAVLTEAANRIPTDEQTRDAEGDDGATSGDVHPCVYSGPG